MGKSVQMVLVLAAAAALAFVIWRQQKLAAVVTNTPATAPSGGGDVYSSILGAVTGAVGVVRAITAPQTA